MIIDKAKLLELAKDACLHSYAKYSQFRVGAALLCADGDIISGSNVENRSFGLTICAERSAIVSALSQGKKKFTALALYCLDAQQFTPPCGACRQVISEFVPPEFPIYIACKTEQRDLSMGELFPYDSLHELVT